MSELLYKIWYRKQVAFESYEVFKNTIRISIVCGMVLCTGVVYLLTKLTDGTEGFIIINVFSFIFTMYNLPTILKEIRNKKSFSIIQMQSGWIYWCFVYVKKNIAVIPWLISMIANIVIGIIVDIKVANILLSVLVVQLIIALFSIVTNKIKLLLVSLPFIMGYLVGKERHFFLLCINLLVLLIIMNILPKILKGYYFVSQYNNRGAKINNTFIGFVLKYLLRIKKKEYVDIIFSSLLAMVIFNFTSSYKLVEMYFVMFFFAKIQLQVEANQSMFNNLYAYNNFFVVRKISYWHRLLYSLEFKNLIIESLSLVIFLGYVLWKGKFVFVGYFVNTILLMLLYINKNIFVFYKKISKKQLYKGGIVNLILFYLIIAIVNLDLIFGESIEYFIGSWVVIGICLIVPFDKLLSVNLLGEKYYEND